MKRAEKILDLTGFTIVALLVLYKLVDLLAS